MRGVLMNGLKKRCGSVDEIDSSFQEAMGGLRVVCTSKEAKKFSADNLRCSRRQEWKCFLLLCRPYGQG